VDWPQDHGLGLRDGVCAGFLAVYVAEREYEEAVNVEPFAKGSPERKWRCEFGNDLDYRGDCAADPDLHYQGWVAED
jgi:hypothetical protein